MIDLVNWAGELADRLASVGDNETELTSESFPELGESVTVTGLKIQKYTHGYEGYIADCVHLHLEKVTSTALGLALLKCELDACGLVINLPEAEGTLGTLQIEASPNGYSVDGLNVESLLKRVAYWPREVTRHPWLRNPPRDVYNYPSFVFQEDYALAYGETGFQEAELLRLNGWKRGQLRLANLLLNLGRAENQCLEVQLEGEGGFRGVAPHSAECRIWLPGSFGYTG